MKRGNIRSDRTRGYSLVELVVVVGLLGFLATTAAFVLSHGPDDLKHQKLVSDVQSLNRAVQTYLVFGGSLDDAVTPADVIARLKSKADELSAKQTAGLTGSHVDPRLSVRMQDTAEAASGELRAIWNPFKQRFEIATSGAPGVKIFELAPLEPGATIETESRDAGMKLAAIDNWIWDFEEIDAAQFAGPTGIATTGGTTGGGGSPGGGIPPGGGTPPGPITPLVMPAFSVPDGRYFITEFPLTLYLLNPNPARYSSVAYQITGGGWQVYTPGTPLRVNPGSSVTAFAQSLDPSRFSDSETRRYDYQVKPIRLNEPAIYVTAPRFDYVAMPSVIVQIVDSNPITLSRLEYRINTGDWADYTGPITLNAVDYPKGAKIRARAMPIVEYYTPSAKVEQLISRPTPLFGGDGDGWFSNPQGPSGMVTNLGPGETDNYFRWGTSTTGAPPSNMSFAGADFSNVEPGVRFQLGTLDYYNGTISASTVANTVELNVEMAFDSGQLYTWDFVLELINTPNGGVTPEEAADIVHLASLTSSASTTIDGDEFFLILEFGETSSGGFSSLDQFHVLEGQSATGTLYATLVAAEDLDDVDPIYLGEGDVDYWDITPTAEPVLAPLLLALDATTFGKDISSIKDKADEHKAKKDAHKDLQHEYQDLADEYADLAADAIADGDLELAAEHQALAGEYQALADEHKALYDYYKDVDEEYLLSEDIYDDERKDIFKEWASNPVPGVKVDNPWLRWSTEFAGDEVLLPGGNLLNHGWWTLPQDKPWAGEKFASGDVGLQKLDRVPNSDFLEWDGLSMLLNRTVVAVVYQDDIYKYGPGYKFTDLSGGRLGRIAFTVIGIELPGGLDESRAGGSLWDIRVRIESPIEPTIYDLDPWTRDIFIDGNTGELVEGGLTEINV